MNIIRVFALIMLLSHGPMAADLPGRFQLIALPTPVLDSFEPKMVVWKIDTVTGRAWQFRGTTLSVTVTNYPTFTNYLVEGWIEMVDFDEAHRRAEETIKGINAVQALKGVK